MKRARTKQIRCVVYTRKSTEHGLELEFNSLDAQREACEAYIKSQASEGWTFVPKHYDDAAYSGGNIQRPALQRLIKDINSGLIDVIVVYKIDRLTRSLADFAKLIEIFDAKSVSFVAVTQQFNTTTSMGRLTLNVLLSFAQFERELSSERVRDKIAASRKKGKWTGGGVPLGYDNVDKKLAVNETEAKTVRTIFARYLDLGSFHALINELDRTGIVTKRRTTKNGVIGGIPFTAGSLAYLLKNRTYQGQVGHSGTWFDGDHQAIVDRDLFDSVQNLMKTNTVTRARQRHDNMAPLTGFLFDDQGNRMSSSFTAKKGVRYPCYVSSAVLKGRKGNAGSVARIPATVVEQLVKDGLRSIATDIVGTDGVLSRAALERHLDRAILRKNKLLLLLKSKSNPIEVPWTAKSSRRTIIVDEAEAKPPAPDPRLAQAIARAHKWVDDLRERRYASIEDLGKANGVHPKVVRNAIRLAFLAPDLTEAILRGEHPAGLNLKHFKNEIPLTWLAQRKMIEGRLMPTLCADIGFPKPTESRIRRLQW